MPPQRFAILKDTRELVAALVLCRDATFLRRPCRIIHAVQSRGGEGGGRERTVLFFQPADLAPIEREQAAALVEAELDEAAGVIACAGTKYRIARTASHDSVFEALDLEPWAAEPRPGRVLVRTGDKALVAETVTRSLRLGSDRMAIAHISANGEPDESAPGTRESGLLLRLDDPSYFLVQELAQRAAANELELYHRPAEAEVYLPWGYAHPLQERLALLAGADRIVFVDLDRRWHRVDAAALRDIYEAIDLELEKFSTAAWTSAGELPRFPVRLRFRHRPNPAEPEMWMLTADQIGRLERILTLVPDNDLKNILVSYQQDAAGNRRFFVRELITGHSRRYLDLAGVQLASQFGRGNLYVPVDLVIEPQVRPDRYRELLGLEAGQITVLIPAGGDGQADGAGIRALKIEESSFRSLERLVDYRIDESAEALREIVAESVFDFAPYEVAAAGDSRDHTPGLWARLRSWLGSLSGRE